MSVLPLAVLFLAVATGASGCNQDALSYNGSCYIFKQISLDIRMARKYCQILEADLAFIHQNATSVISFDPAQKYWVSENSERPRHLPTAAPSQCPYIYQQTLEYGDCNEDHFFLCEGQENPTQSCPEGWMLLNGTCYKAVQQLSNLTSSISACHSDQGSLAILDDKGKEMNAEAIIMGLDNIFLVGAQRENGTFKWFNEKRFNPSCSTCTIMTLRGNCLGYKSSSSHPTMFQWVGVECSSVNSFLCDRESSTVNTVLTTPLPATTSSPAPILLCPTGYNWKAFKDTNFCFWETTYESERLNWYQARQFCQAYGGDLASYRNAQEEDTGLGGAKGHYKGLWFGLQRGEDDIFRWVDGMELNYTNWDYNEPNLKSKTHYCVSHSAGNARWELDYCGVRRWFVCKAPKVRIPTLPSTSFPKTACNFSASPFYRHRWYSYKNHCYLIHDEAKYSWDLANNFCKDNEAHLASIHSFNETDFILFASNIVSSSDYWIGLSSKGLGSSFTWSDGTPLDFLYWGSDRNETERTNVCVSFDPVRGYWKTSNHCNKLQGVICKRGINASYDFPTQEPDTVLPGNCENGWYPLGNKCYKVFGKKWTQRMSWPSAQKACENKSATLASVHNDDQQNFLTDLMLEIDDDAWIGLENLHRGSLFQWTDNTALDYANWDVNEPSISNDDEDSELFYTSSYERTCVEISYGRENMGKWNDVSCYQSNAYICQKYKNPNITKPSEDPFLCTNLTGWSRLGTSCYGIFEDKNKTLGWTQAQSQCRAYGADLVSFKNSAVAVFLSKRISSKNEFFWTGIRETEPSKFGTFNGKKLKISNWLTEQPKLMSSFMDNCVAMNSQSKWIVRSCADRLLYVCEWNSDPDNEISVDESHLCPKTYGWQDIGGDMCVKTFFVRETWNDAMYNCFRHGGSLVTFHSAKDLHLFIEHVNTNYRFTSVHIGLGRRSDGSYMWADYSPVDFTAWDPDDAPSTIKDCVELDLKTEKWKKVHCDDVRRNYFCSASKDRSVEEDISGSNSTKAENIVSKKLAVGGIIGIVICLLVVLAIIGVTVHYLCPRKRPRKLLVPESQL